MARKKRFMYTLTPIVFTDKEMYLDNTRSRTMTFLDMLENAVQLGYIDTENKRELLFEYDETEAYKEMAEVYAVHEQHLTQD